MGLPRKEYANGPDLVGAARIGLSEVLRDRKRLLEIATIDDIETKKLLFGLRKRPVDHQWRFVVLAQGRSRSGRQEAGDRAEFALPLQFFHDDPELGHDGVVLLLAPGASHLFIVVAENSVLHGGSCLRQGRSSGAGTDTVRKISGCPGKGHLSSQLEATN